MADTTPWYASRTIWAGAVGVMVPVIGMAFHITVTDAQIQEVVTDLTIIGGAVSGLAAIYYRVKASKPISGTAAAAAAQTAPPPVIPTVKGS